MVGDGGRRWAMVGGGGVVGKNDFNGNCDEHVHCYSSQCVLRKVLSVRTFVGGCVL